MQYHFFYFFIIILCIAEGINTSKQLIPAKYKFLKTGSIKPQSWLKTQLELQRDGLAGYLSKFWPDIMDSVWIGGSHDTDLHERTPYWLNGLVPLAFQLESSTSEEASTTKKSNDLCTSGVDMPGFEITTVKIKEDQECYDLCMQTDNCVGFVISTCIPLDKTCELKHTQWSESKESCKCYGKIDRQPTAVNLTEQMHKYIDYIITHQDEDGWLGPKGADGNEYWGRSDVLLSLIQYTEAMPETFTNITNIILNYLLRQKQMMNTTKLFDWAKARWIDMEIGVIWMLENAPQGHEDDLWELAQMLHDQGSDWDSWFVNFQGDAGTHNVNNAQGLKSAAIWYRFSGNQSMHNLSLQRMHNIDDNYGVPTGMFIGDENMPQPPSRHPSRGSELCGVVESMFSYNIMFQVFGDVAFADRVERIAFNALPATWASPRGGDMWNHQYLQGVNEINSQESTDHIWGTDGPDAELYGLAPNYGCCTANFPQGWPKFTNMIVFETQDNGAAIGAYAPVIAQLPSNVGGGATIQIWTTYPFSDLINVIVTAKSQMPLYLRIPEWADQATVNSIPQKNGTMAYFSCSQGQTTFALNLNPKIRIEKWYAYSILRGSLLFSLPIKLNFTLLEHHFGTIDQSNDYQIEPLSNWNYALDVDPQNPEENFKFVQGQYIDSQAPFNHTNWPVYIIGLGRTVNSWGIVQNAADYPPSSPACAVESNCGSQQQLVFVPHGSTDLRMGEFPLSQMSESHIKQ